MNNTFVKNISGIKNQNKTKKNQHFYQVFTVIKPLLSPLFVKNKNKLQKNYEMNFKRTQVINK